MNNARYYRGGVHLPITAERRQGTNRLVSADLHERRSEALKEVILRG